MKIVNSNSFSREAGKNFGKFSILRNENSQGCEILIHENVPRGTLSELLRGNFSVISGLDIETGMAYAIIRLERSSGGRRASSARKRGSDQRKAGDGITSRRGPYRIGVKRLTIKKKGEL